MAVVDIVLVYRSIDNVRIRRKFQTLKAAQTFAHKYVGKHPDISFGYGYAVSGDGIGKIVIERGTNYTELFPPK